MKKFLIRISVLFIILAVFVYYISKNLGTIKQTVNVTLSQSALYLLLASLFAALAFFFVVMMHHKVFEMLGIRRTRLEMFLLQTQSLAMNVLVPSAGVSVGVVFAGDAKKRGDSTAAAITGVILTLLVDYVSIAILLTISMIYLASVGALGLHVIVPAAAFFLLAIGLYMLIYFAGRNQKLLKRILDFCKNVINKVFKFFKRPVAIKSETQVDKFIVELSSAYEIMRRQKKSLFQALGYILTSHFMYLVCMYILFLSLGIDPMYRVMLAGYAIGIMVVVISPTPNGVGFVEGSMALAYTSMGVPGAAAAAVTLIYRGFCFWVPLLVGFVALQRKHLLGLAENMQR